MTLAIVALVAFVYLNAAAYTSAYYYRVKELYLLPDDIRHIIAGIFWPAYWAVRPGLIIGDRAGERRLLAETAEKT